MPRDLVCFDLDGTLLDPRGSIRAAIDRALGDHGHSAIAEHEVLIGMPLRDILRTRSRDDAEVESMVQRFRDVYVSETWRLARFVPGVMPVVERLRRDGLRTAIVTTKGEQEATIVLEHLGVADLFDTVVGDDDARPLKPDPAPVLEACRRLERATGDACMVGDTTYDVEAGRAAGVVTVGVLWGHGGHDDLGTAGADHLVEDAEGLEEVLRAWAGMPRGAGQTR